MISLDPISGRELLPLRRVIQKIAVGTALKKEKKPFRAGKRYVSVEGVLILEKRK